MTYTFMQLTHWDLTSPPPLCISTPFPDAIQTKQRYSSYSPHTQNPYIIIIPFNIYINHHTLVCAY